MIEISTEEKDDAVILSISGEITLNGVNDFDIACKKYNHSNLKVLAIDLKRVQFIDSIGISRFIKQSKVFSAKGTKFVLININEDIEHVFQIAGFDRLFTILTNAEFSEKFL